MTDTVSARTLTRTIPEALERAASTRHGIRLIDRNLEGPVSSYADLYAAAQGTAGALRARGVRPGDRVCLLSTTTMELLVCLYGTWMAGAAPVVLSLPRRQSDLQELISDVQARVDAVGARLLCVSRLFLAEADPRDITSLPVATVEELAAATDEPAEPAPVGPDDLAFLQFTSGTTSAPRAVALTHGQIVTNMRDAGGLLGIGADTDVVVSWLPLFHDMGLIGMLLGATIFAIPLVLEPTEEFLGRPGSWMDAISTYRGTITAAPNFGYGLAARDLRMKPRDVDLTCCRIAVNGAEPIDAETLQGFTEMAAPYGFRPEAMCPMYGLAEATLAVTGSRPDEPLHTDYVSRTALEQENTARPVPADDPDARALVPCGHRVPGVEVAICDEDGRRLGPNAVGEIWVRGPSTMLGYWSDEEATADALRDGWLHTGDLGFLGEHGLYICGRAKDMIILRGRNHYPEDYETSTERVSGVRRGNVIAFAIPERERMVVVAETTATSADEAERIATEVLHTLRRRLPRGPEEVVLVAPGTLPKTSSGKRQRRSCRELYASGGLAPMAVVGR